MGIDSYADLSGAETANPEMECRTSDLKKRKSDCRERIRNQPGSKSTLLPKLLRNFFDLFPGLIQFFETDKRILTQVGLD